MKKKTASHNKPTNRKGYYRLWIEKRLKENKIFDFKALLKRNVFFFVCLMFCVFLLCLFCSLDWREKSQYVESPFEKIEMQWCLHLNKLNITTSRISFGVEGEREIGQHKKEKLIITYFYTTLNRVLTFSSFRHKLSVFWKIYRSSWRLSKWKNRKRNYLLPLKNSFSCHEPGRIRRRFFKILSSCCNHSATLKHHRLKTGNCKERKRSAVKMKIQGNYS